MKIKKYERGMKCDTINGEALFLKKEIPELIKALGENYPEIFKEAGWIKKGEGKCQCGLDEPCSEGLNLLQGEMCSAGFRSCYLPDERLGIADKGGPNQGVSQ